MTYWLGNEIMYLTKGRRIVGEFRAVSFAASTEMHCFSIRRIYFVVFDIAAASRRKEQHP